ncbi:MAG TPA: TonB-dependent receptor [Nevskiaceae bacterium]|nr:TonB-dependent receptor [Nevskiaceae bacterium]
MSRWSLLLLLLPLALAAEDAPVSLDPVQVTAGRIRETVFEAPQGVTVVGREQIERQAPGVMSDLLRGEPGVFTQSSGPGQGIVIVRGLKGSEVLHLVDGMRLNNAFFRNSPSQYIALIDPYALSRIELLRGPAGTLYGSDAMGGVLQVFTPEERFGGADWQTRAGLLTQYGSASQGQLGRISGAIGREGLSLAGGISYADYGHRKTADQGRVQPSAYFSRAADAKLLWEPGAHEAMLAVQHFEVPSLPRTFEVTGGPGGEPSSLQAFFRPNSRDFLHARYRYRGVLGGVVEGLEIHLARQVIDDDRFRQPNSSRVENEFNRSTLDGLTLQAESDWGPLSLRYGGEWYRDRIASRKTRTSLANGETSADISLFPDGALEDSRGLYLFAEWRPQPRWLVDTGLRYSHIETELPATPVSAAARIRDEALTGQIGTAFRLTPRLNWVSNLGRGFRAPNLFDLGTLGRRPNSAPEQVNVPNPGLRPETLLSLESGLKLRSRQWRAELMAWASRYEDKIEPREPTGNTVPEGQFGCSSASGCLEVRSENLSELRLQGVESTLRWLDARWEGYASLNWTYGQESRAGAARTPANRIPPLNGQLGGLWRPRSDGYLEGFLQFAARQDRLDDDDLSDIRIDPRGTAGWVTLNTRLGWTPQPGLLLQLEGRNLLDAAYREHGSGIDGEARGVLLSLRWQTP